MCGDEHNTNKCVSTAQHQNEPFYIQWHMMNTAPLDIMFFCEKYLLAMDEYIVVIPAHLHWVQIKHLMRN